MNINELDKFDLRDAVKFHDRLNPQIWGRNEHMLPAVRERLLATAADFQEFLGVPDLDVVDITVSGSNAAYSYTDGSDIDLHLVVRMPAQNSEVFQELFNAKKYQYNNEHDIRIGGADVELYVQPADQPHVSQGIYSVRDQKWLAVPRRRRAEIDDQCVQHKSEDLAARIDAAVASGDAEQMSRLWDKIKNMRKVGLETHGEFGCDNLVFKMLRRSGHIEQLKKAKTAAHDQALSLAERKKRRSKFRWGYGGYFAPGFSFGGEAGEGGGGDGGGESMREGHQGQPYSSEDGVAPSTQMFLNETDQDEKAVQAFIDHTVKKLGIKRMPKVVLHRDDDWAVDQQSFGMYQPDTHELHVNLAGRHLMDVLRTTAHELVHCRQHEINALPADAGDTGSPWENQAHAMAGVIMRDWADRHPEFFDRGVMEGASGYIPKNKREAQMPQYAMALSVDIKPGQVGKEANKLALNTGRNGEPTLLMKTANLREGRMPQPSQRPGRYKDLNKPLGPETPPTMPAGTVRVDVSDVYDWYKLGQHISNLKGLGKHDFGKGPPSTVVSFGDEDTEHKFIQDLKATGLDVTDIDPRDPQQPPGMPKIKTDPTYNVDEDLVESLRQEFELLEDEFLPEIKMSPTNLRAEAAKTGAMAGMEFEMIVPAIGGADDVEYEPNYDRDERCRSISDAVDFFFDGDYNGRRDVERLRERMRADYEEWVMEQIDSDWENDKDDVIRSWVEENVDPAEWLSLVNDNTSEEEAFEQFVGDIVDDSDNDYHQQALDEFREEKYQDYDENDWLGDQDLDMMSKIENAYEISWPYWNETSSGAGDIDQVADSFSQAIGRPVNASSRYHGGTREAGKYVVEPDGSLQPSDDNDMGLEFVSPPLPLDELLSDLNKVKAWADQNGCYTGKANKTGLHINVSVPGYDLSKLDYVKLALLLGDEYVLQQFGRSAESYAKSSMGKVREIVRQNPDRAQALLDKMRGHMNQFASRAIASGSTDKFVSINTLDKDGYIEFRSPGGDWLDANFEKIENTLLRFTVAMAAAIDPEAYREEYQKKLYKLLTQDQDKTNTDTIRHFADYVAGKIPQAALRSFVKQAQLQRQISKEKQPGKKYWWRVYKDGKGAANSAILELVASSKAEAIDLAGREWGLFSREYRNIMDAEPVRPYEEKPATKPVATGPQRDYEIVNLANRTVVERFRASSDEEAQEYFDRIIAPGDQLFYDVRPAPAAEPTAARPNRPNIGSQTDMENRLGWPDQTGDANYEIVDRRTQQPVFVFIANTEADGANKYQQWLAAAGYSSDPQELAWRRRETTQAAPQQSSGEFTGNWLIQDPQGRTIHRFGGVGNVQSDANRAAITWLRAHPGSMQAGVTVVPEMQ